MTESRPRMRNIALAALALLLASSCQLGTPAPPIRYWVLGSLEGLPQVSESRYGVVVGPVELPPYLDRAGIVTRIGQHRLAVAALDQWGEPLRRGISRVVANNLGLLSPGVKAIPFPWTGGGQPELQLSFSVSRMVARPESDFTLVVTWALRRSGAQEALIVQTSTIRESIRATGDDSIAGVVAAASRALERLSREIAAALPRSAETEAPEADL
jgi:uncharacterized lipoprotein YmbA